jgi:ABC-type transporter Mla maintaining outer membrane lipid asymmetry ATPase subunit MlaF
MLDYPQKKAVKYALEDNIVIQGPPGTGKSETISNIIANLAYRLHSVLFVAEKRTAGEVVYNRLKSIKYYTLMLFDDDDFNLFFTNQLKIGLDRVSFWLQRQTELNNKKYEEKVRLDQVFTKVDTFRKLMSTDTGKKYPIFLSLTSQNGKELEKDLFTLQDIIYKYDDQKEF